MIERVGQTQQSYLQQVKQVQQPKQEQVAQVDAYVPSTKHELWSYSRAEVRAPRASSFSNEPSWDKMATKGMRTLSYAEIALEVKQVAQQRALLRTATTHDAQWQREWDAAQDAYIYLQNQYISDVSPDRKALYEQAKKELRNKKDDEVTYPVTFTLVDILCDLDDLQDVGQQHGTLTTAYTTGYGTDYEISVGGERVMMTNRGEWQWQMTTLEQKKQAEFQAMYNRAFELAEKQLKKV